jgi:hypothetical protein
VSVKNCVLEMLSLTKPNRGSKRFGLLNLSITVLSRSEGDSYHCDYVCSVYGKYNLGSSVTCGRAIGPAFVPTCIQVE